MPKSNPFSEPEFTERDNQPVEFSEALSVALTDGVSSNGDDAAGPDPNPLREFSTDAREAVLEFELWASSRNREHGRLFDSHGAEIWRGAGEPDQISVPEGPPDSVFTHNHPKGTPPSAEDLIVGALVRLRELRVITPIGTGYSIRYESETFDALGALRSRFAFLDSASWAVTQEWIRSTGARISEHERMCRRFHAMFLQLARDGFLSYCRFNARR